MSELEEINNYKALIYSYVKRIISNHIDLKPVKIDEANFNLKFIFTKPEWFLELDDDMQYNIEYNVRLYFKDNYDKITSVALEIMK